MSEFASTSDAPLSSDPLNTSQSEIEASTASAEVNEAPPARSAASELEETNKEGEGGRMEEEEEEDEEELAAEEESSFAATPNALTNLRACKRCGLLKTFTQFYDQGCENCPFFDMQEDQARVSECTSSFYGGVYSMINPSESWMAKWLRLKTFKRGCYAMSVEGEYGEEVQVMLQNKGIRSRCELSWGVK